MSHVDIATFDLHTTWLPY